jgi:flagellar motor switch protein FliM
MIVADGQTIGGQTGVLARKLARARAGHAGFGMGAMAAMGADGAALDAAVQGAQQTDFPAGETGPAVSASDPHIRAWRLALARAARDQLKMTVGFSEVTCTQASLTEVLESPMQRALILMLQGRGEGMGLMILSGQMLAAMVEILTLTHLSAHAPDEADLRKPTRTDAAMAVEFIDAALAGFESVMADSAGLAGAGLAGVGGDWAAGYRYAAFIDDPRPLHLMLEDGDYHLLMADLVLEDGSRSGKIYLALPVPPPALDLPAALPFDVSADPDPLSAVQEEDTFQADLAAQVQDLGVQLDASLAQISLPIERIMRLAVGEVLPLPLANLDHISLRGLDGFRVAGARLGQNRGMRALRLTDVASPRKADPALTVPPAGGAMQHLAPQGQAMGQGHAMGQAMGQGLPSQLGDGAYGDAAGHGNPAAAELGDGFPLVQSA